MHGPPDFGIGPSCGPGPERMIRPQGPGRAGPGRFPVLHAARLDSMETLQGIGTSAGPALFARGPALLVDPARGPADYVSRVRMLWRDGRVDGRGFTAGASAGSACARAWRATRPTGSTSAGSCPTRSRSHAERAPPPLAAPSAARWGGGLALSSRIRVLAISPVAIPTFRGRLRSPAKCFGVS